MTVRPERASLEALHPDDFPRAAGDLGPALGWDSRESTRDRPRIGKGPFEIGSHPARAVWVDVRIERPGALVAFLSHEAEVDDRGSHGGRGDHRVGLPR